MANGVNELQYLIPEIWSTKGYDRLKAKVGLFSNIFAKDYDGEIKQKGDTVNVHQIGALTAETLASDKSQFSTQDASWTNFQIIADRIVVNAVEFTDLAKLQSLEYQEEVMGELIYGLQYKMEQDVISALLPSSSSPDHTIAPASAGDLAAVDLATIRTLMSQAKVPLANRYLALAPTYYGDLLQKNTVTSLDFVSGNSAQSGVLSQFMGLQIFEHDILSDDVGYAVHPSALQIVTQKSIEIKISDQHANRKLGYLMSAHMVWGLKLMDNKRIIKISG